MKTLVIGATGYFGTAICKRFRASGRDVCGMARNAGNREKLAAAGVPSVDGTLEDIEGLKDLVRGFDTIAFVPMIPLDQERTVLEALIDACRGTNRHLMFASGTGVLAIASPDATWDENTFAEDDPFPFPARVARKLRLPTEDMVRAAAAEGVRTTVIRPPWVWGNGGGILVAKLMESVAKTGDVCYVGHGLNLYSNVHVDDVAQAFELAVDRGTPGALYHTVAGEADIRSVAEAVAQMMGCGTRSIDYETACEIWPKGWVDIILVVNSRSRCPRARAELGWEPQHIDVIEDIRSGSYRAAYEASLTR